MADSEHIGDLFGNPAQKKKQRGRNGVVVPAKLKPPQQPRLDDDRPPRVQETERPDGVRRLFHDHD